MGSILIANWTRFIAISAAILVAVIAAPLLERAQAQSAPSKYANATITVRTSRGNEDLHVSETGCSGSVTGPGTLIAVGDSCWLWSHTGDVPRSISVKIATDQVSFVRSGKSYVIRDAATVRRARDMFAPFIEDMVQRERELGDEQRSLGEKQHELGEQQAGTKVQVPDMSADFEKVEADAKRLSAEGGTQSELSELQSQLSELQSRLSELQSQASEQESALSEQQSALGQTQSELSSRQAELSQHGVERAQQASRQLKDLLDQSVANGSAKPE